MSRNKVLLARRRRLSRRRKLGVRQPGILTNWFVREVARQFVDMDWALKLNQTYFGKGYFGGIEV